MYTILLLCLVQIPPAPPETHRIIGTIISETEIDVDGTIVKFKFRGSRKALLNAIDNKRDCLWGRLIIDKKKKQFRLFANKITVPERSNRIETYNGDYSVSSKNGLAVVDTQYGEFKLSIINGENKYEGAGEIHGVIYYYNEEEDEIYAKMLVDEYIDRWRIQPYMVGNRLEGYVFLED